jgi:hypothetical protein
MTDLAKEFKRQSDNLIRLGYPMLARLTVDEFCALLEPLEQNLSDVEVADINFDTGRLPFTIVVGRPLVPPELTIGLIDRNGEKAFEKLDPLEPNGFSLIDNLRIPDRAIYFIVDVDRGDEYRNITPTDAIEAIREDNRSPLSMEEGIAVLTHYPEFLMKNHCFSLPASRAGKRVPAIWISEKRPKLGWCWAGNPHTWLGSASCKARF